MEGVVSRRVGAEQAATVFTATVSFSSCGSLWDECARRGPPVGGIVSKERTTG